MQYPGIVFLFYFLPALLIVYHVLGFSRTLRGMSMLLASLVFLGWGGPGFALAVLAGVLANWVFGLLLAGRRASAGGTRTITVAAVLCNLALFAGHRYAGMPAVARDAADGFPALAGGGSLPALGMAVFTLQALSYVLDVRAGKAEAERNPIVLGAYLAFFAPLAAGPVQRFADMARQVREGRGNFAMLAEGCARLVVGMGKIVLVAPGLGAASDRVFELSRAGLNAATVPAGLAWTGLVLFGLFLYVQLSGYADMAVGLGGMFGFSCRENFDHPYAARSMTDFWRRWNMTLIAWFAEYLGVEPAGGRSAPGQPRKSTARALLLTWALIGLWHGAGWTFAIWGVWHGVFLFAESAVAIPENRYPSWLGRVYMVFVVAFGWVFFRSENFGEAVTYLANLFAINYNGWRSDLALAMLRENAAAVAVAALLCFPALPGLERRVRGGSSDLLKAAFGLLQLAVLAAILLLSVVYLARNGYVAALPL